MKGSDVKGYIRQLDDIISQGLAVGQITPEEVKLSHLIRVAQKVFTFKNSINMLKIAGQGKNYRIICQTLISNQEEMELIQPRMNAPMLRANVAQSDRSELYWKGKRDPAHPEKPAVREGSSEGKLGCCSLRAP